MNARIENLRRRRQLLISQAAAQRSEVSFIKTNLQHRLRVVDFTFSLVQAIRVHPALTTASVTTLLPPPKNKLLRWGSRLFTVWEIFSVVRRQWQEAGSRSKSPEV